VSKPSRSTPLVLVAASLAVVVAYAAGRRGARPAARANAPAIPLTSASASPGANAATPAPPSVPPANARALPSPLFTVSASAIGAGAPPGETRDGGATPTGPPPSVVASARARLGGETNALRAARAAIERKDGARALAILDQHDHDYPDGLLGPDARVLRIQALATSGHDAEALSRADAFLLDYPHSPEAARVRELADALRATHQP